MELDIYRHGIQSNDLSNELLNDLKYKTKFKLNWFYWTGWKIYRYDLLQNKFGLLVAFNINKFILGTKRMVEFNT